MYLVGLLFPKQFKTGKQIHCQIEIQILRQNAKIWLGKSKEEIQKLIQKTFNRLDILSPPQILGVLCSRFRAVK